MHTGNISRLHLLIRRYKLKLLWEHIYHQNIQLRFTVIPEANNEYI